MNTTLLLGARIVTSPTARTRERSSPASQDATAMAIVDGKVTWVGPDDAAPREAFDHTVRLDGALVTPAFVDTHVHCTNAGLLLTGLDLARCGSLAEVLRAVADFAASQPDGTVVWGHGWDETRWPEHRPPTRDELDTAVGDRPAYLSRIDMHSALVTSTLAAGTEELDGYSPTEPLATHAHHAVRRAALAAITPAQRRAAQRTFLTHAASLGIAHLHECAGPDISGLDDLAELLSTVDGPQVVGYWGQQAATVDEARELLAASGAHGLAGDLFCDGSLGSRTAALREPYADAPHTQGHAYLDPEAIAAHVVACTQAGVQAGFHVIGDAAMANVIAGFRLAERSLGHAALAGGRHRLEHVEMIDAEQVAALAGWGVRASMQPRFDELWGGAEGMYARRLGAERAERMNPFAALAAAGVELAFSSDSPVTETGPWAAVQAAVRHKTQDSRLPVEAAFAAHTAGGHRAAGSTDPHAGTLTPGAPASYAVWDTDRMPALDGAQPLPRCLRTARHGEVIFDAGALP
jgi:predicted amidohydrolase YtcJ